MSERQPDIEEGQGTVEVVVYQDGRLLHRQLCESENEAADVVAEWRELRGVSCDVEDVSGRHDRAGNLELEPPELPDDRGPGPA